MVDVEKDFNLAVGRRIRKMRETLHMTREQFSELCSISDSFLAAVERGEKSITSKTLYKICTGAHISVDYLIFGSQNDFQNDAVLELLGELDDSQRESAMRILSEFVTAMRYYSADI